MKKITMMFLMSLLSFAAFAQFPEGFEGTWPPAGWGIYDNGLGTNIWAQSMAGNPTQPAHTGDHAAYLQKDNVLTGLPEDWLVTPQFEVPANPQLRFWSALTQGGNQGSLYDVKISTDPDQSNLAAYVSLLPAPWTELQINPGDQADYLEKLVSIPAALVGQDVYIAFIMTGDDGDRWLIDDVNVVSQCLDPTTLGASNFGLTTAELSWTGPAGATSWEVEVAGALDPATGIADYTPDTSSFTATGLTQDTDYKFYVRAVCGPGNTSAWVGPFYFSTVPEGATCEAPIAITTDNYSTSNNTSNFGDDYNGTVGSSGCGTTGNFLNGDDVVYSYTPTETGVVSVSMTNNGANSGMFIYGSCADIGVSCIAGGTGNATTPVNIAALNVTAGTTYYIVISTSGTTQSTPYTLTIQQVFCAPPVGLPTTNVDEDSADLSWTNPSSATSWQVVVQPNNTGLPAGAGTTVATNTNYNVTATTAGAPFTPATAYEYYVRADCGDGNFSAWAGPYTFSTTQIPASLNFADDFEGTPAWTLSNGGHINKWVIGTATSNGGTHSLYISNDNGVTNAYTGTNPAIFYVHAYKDIQLPAAIDQISVSFDWKCVGESTFDYLRAWVVPATYVPVPGTQIPAGTGEQIGANYNQNNSWTTVNGVADVSAYAGQVVRVVFEWRNDTSVANQPPAAVDNVNVAAITCPSPTNLAVSDIGQNEATVSWDGPISSTPTFDYYVSETNTAPTAGTTPTANVTAEEVDLTGLDENTVYYVWVRSNCGATDGNSFWVGPISFNTLCGAFPVPFYEGFNSDSTTEACWTVLNLNGDGDAWNMNYATNPYEGNQMANLYTDFNGGNNDDWLISPTINLTGNERLRYHYRVQSAGEPNDFEVRVSTTGTDPADFTTTLVPLASYNNTTYVEVIVNLTDGTDLISGPVNIAWHVPNGGLDGWRVYIDNVIVEPIPTCPDPTGLAVVSLTENSAELTWEPGLNETQWQVVVQPAGTGEPTAGVPPTSDNDPYEVTGLNPSTQYEFYVRAHCADDDLSNWVGPVNFTTAQIPADMDFTEDFEGDIEWTFVNGTNVNQWVVGTATSNSPTHSLYISNDNGVSNAYTGSNPATTYVHAYRDIQMPADVDQVDLSFDWKGIGESSFDYMRVWIVPVAYGPVAGTEITAAPGRLQIGGNFNQNPNWTNANYVLDGSQFEGQIIRLVFQWRYDTSVANQPPAAVDNIDFSIVTCPKPVDLAVLSVTSGEVEVDWTPVGPATQWEVIVVPAGSPAPAADAEGVIADEHPFTVEDLIPGTLYDVYVRSVCAGDDTSKWTGPVEFETDPLCPEPENLEISCISSTGANFTWEAGGTETSWEYAVLPASDPFPTSGTVTTEPLVYATGLTPETDYVYYVRSICPGVEGGFSTWAQLEFTTPTTSVGDATPFCASENEDQFILFDNVDDSDNVTEYGQVACLGSTPNPVWYYLQVEEAGDLDFELIQNTAFDANGNPIGTGLDVDFAAFGPFTSLNQACDQIELVDCPTCPNNTGNPNFYPFGNIIDCSYSIFAVENFSIPNAQPGEIYAVLITNFNGDPGQIKLQQLPSSTGTTNCNILYSVELGEDQFICGDTETTITAQVTTPGNSQEPTYQWFMDDEEFEPTIVETGELHQTIEVNEPGSHVYTVVITVENAANTEPITDEVTVVLGPAVNAPDPEEVLLCGEGGTAEIDLTTLNGDILGDLDTTQFEIGGYFPTEADAIANTGAIDTSAPYTATTEVIYVRVQSILVPDCYDVVALQITVSDAASATISYDGSPFCSGTGSVPVTHTGSEGGSYTATGGLTIDPVTGAIDITADTDAGTYTITYTIAETESCDEFSTTTEIEVIAIPEFTVNDDFSICEGTSGTITVTPVNFDAASPDITYAWTLNGELLPDTTSSISVTEAGDYEVTVSNQGCEATDSVTVTVTPIPVADDPADVTMCDSYTLPALTVGSYYTETGGAGTMLTAGDVITSTQTIYVYAQSGTTPNCTDENSFVVTIVQSPVADDPADVTMCDSYTLPALTVGNYFTEAGGAGTMLSEGDIIISTQTIYVYAETGTTPNCTDENSFEVTIVPAPVADAPGDVSQCDEYALPALSPGNNYYTATGATGTMLNAGDVITSTQVIYVYTSNGTCADENAFTVNIIPTPMLGAIVEGCDGKDYVLEAMFADGEEFYTVDNADFAWSRTPGGEVIGTESTLVATEIGMYYVTVTPTGSTIGCSATAEINVLQTTCDVPRGISPNNDAKNDSFDLSGLHVKKLGIFNRYGKEVFSFSGDYTNQWAGQDKGGNDLPTGTYFYMFERDNGESQTGWVYINREE